MNSETPFFRPRGLEELDEEVRKIKTTLRKLVSDISYALYKITKALEDEKMLTYEESYDLRKLREDIAELKNELEEDGGDP